MVHANQMCLVNQYVPENQVFFAINGFDIVCVENACNIKDMLNIFCIVTYSYNLIWKTIVLSKIFI